MKNARIAATQRATRQRRKTQVCKVFTLGIQSNKLSARQKEALGMVFVEAKWLYNDALASGDVFTYTPGATVGVLDKHGDRLEREFRFLGSQMKQSVIQGMKASIKALSTRKKNGGEVGRLSFRSQVCSLDLKQAGTTYRVRGSKAKVQNIPGWVRVHGATQLEGWEIANAKLIQTPKGYELKVTAYQDKNEHAKTLPTPSKECVGIDMGVKTHLTFSDGRKVDVSHGETERLKRLSRKLSRQQEGSNGWNNTCSLIDREYQEMDERKADAANKIVHDLVSTYKVIYLQDENISAWKRTNGYIKAGRKLQHSVLGRVKAKLMGLAETNPEQVVVLDRFAPTTAMCVCGTKTPHHVSKRTFECSHCGHREDRDTHAAKNMIWMGNNPNGQYLRAGGNKRGRSGCKTRQDRATGDDTQTTQKPEAATSSASR